MRKYKYEIVASRMIPRCVRLLFRWLVVFVVMVLTIEVCARTDDSISYGAPFFSKYTHSRLSRYEDGLVHNVPNARFEKWQNNNLGFRGPDIQVQKTKNIRRIVCLGSSESYGLYESPDMEWPSQLRRLLDDSFFEVINASVVGLSLKNYPSYLKKFILPLDPDKVVLVINPLFVACQLEKKRNTDLFLIPPISIKNKREVGGDEKGFQWRSISKLKQVVKTILKEYFPAALTSYQLKKMDCQIANLEHKFLGDTLPLDSVPDDSIKYYREYLVAVIELLEKNNVAIILTTYPSLISASNINQYPEVFLDNRRFCISFSFKGMVDIFDKFNKEITALADRKNIPLVDMAHNIPKSLECFGDNVHYTDQGSTLFSESIAKKIIDEN